MLQFRRWLRRTLLPLVTMMWFATMFHIDHQLLLVSTRSKGRPWGGLPQPPPEASSNQESLAWRSGYQEPLQAVGEVVSDQVLEEERVAPGDSVTGGTPQDARRRTPDLDGLLLSGEGRGWEDGERETEGASDSLDLLKKLKAALWQELAYSATVTLTERKAPNMSAAEGLNMSLEKEAKISEEMSKITAEKSEKSTHQQQISTQYSRILADESIARTPESIKPEAEQKVLEEASQSAVQEKESEIPTQISAEEPKISLERKIPTSLANFKPASLITQTPGQASNIRLTHEVDPLEVSLTEEEVASVKEQIKQVNDDQEILNQHIFGPVVPNTSVLLVQVHKRLENLHYLVESMSAVEGINKSLVIFSHDLWDPAINAFVRNITNFRVMQMFFPFSLQLHARTFPGNDPADCAWNSSRESRDGIECPNQPDMYGHYREAPLTQIKHHWWWKLRRVFEELRATREAAGWVVFLEEDHYLAPDLLHVLHRLLEDKEHLCHYCQVIALGNYKRVNGDPHGNTAVISDWHVTQHNLGYSFNKDTWRVIRACDELFCTFDDYNWDWTLLRLVQSCCKPRLAMLALTFSRVLHAGSCGTHVKKNGCNVKDEIKSQAYYYEINFQWLFPAVLKLLGLQLKTTGLIKPNGGWGDKRDHQLCQAIGQGTATNHTLLQLQQAVGQGTATNHTLLQLQQVVGQGTATNHTLLQLQQAVGQGTATNHTLLQLQQVVGQGTAINHTLLQLQ
nr:alpha-1,6-mannosyl-glycoprotein 2-beta-N-acetylglucosaminyltransferase-like [Procambarus clarkii]